MAAAATEYGEIAKREIDTLDTVFTFINESLKKNTPEKKQFTLTIQYTPNESASPSIHKCILYVKVSSQYILFIILKDTEDSEDSENSCVHIIYNNNTGQFNAGDSIIRQNSRKEDEPHCFYPVIPDVSGSMTDFLQILSSKLKLRFHQYTLTPSPIIKIWDKATAVIRKGEIEYRLPLFKFRFLRGYLEPSIYQKYGYEFIDKDDEEVVSKSQWDTFSEYIRTVTPKLILDTITPTKKGKIVITQTLKKALTNAFIGIKEIIGDYDETTPLPDLLKRIDSVHDARYKISDSIFDYLLTINFETEGFPNDSLVEVELNINSEGWASAEKKLIITEVTEGNKLENSAPTRGTTTATTGGGGAVFSASGGARLRQRQRTLRRHSNKRKTRRSRDRPKLDRVWAA